jgi:cytosine/adenosine deaminase-related metal-dependent hydrolase
MPAALARGLDSSDAGPADLWLAATKGGAEALGLGEATGSLKMGYSADLAVLEAGAVSAARLPEDLLDRAKVLCSIIRGNRMSSPVSQETSPSLAEGEAKEAG